MVGMSKMYRASAILTLFLLSSLSPFFFQIPDSVNLSLAHPVPEPPRSTEQSTVSVWDEMPFRTIAMPNGFAYLDVINYSDVAVLINNNSDVSKEIAWAFIEARNISEDRIFIFDQPNTPTGETINRNQFETYFLEPMYEMLMNRSNSSQINYLVTTKGIPLRVSGGQNTEASFDQEISLLGGRYNESIGDSWWITHNYGPIAGNSMEAFTRQEYGFFLVTRLTGYTTETAIGLIEKANNSLGNRGNFVLDLATNRNGSGYKYWNDDLYTANTTLNGTYNLPVFFDQETEFVTNVSNVIGYASWGSNDGNWNANYLPNSGFDTADSSWSTQARFWSHTLPSTMGNESIEIDVQSSKKQGGANALSVTLSPDCSGQDAEGMNGLLSEYFDNRGTSFNTNAMPILEGRFPNAVTIQPTINFPSTSNPHPGLDSRFKETFSVRFTSSIDIPEDGNWTFYLNSDDGSEMWLDGVSLIQNHGTHGMREYSGYRNLSSGYHELRVEMFQGGGPHGVILSWEGPNQTKAVVPASAYKVFTDRPQSDSILHSWDFETGSGSIAFDGQQSANLTLYDMNSTNWVNCPGGTCLYFDGIDDYAQVDVQDWAGNMTVSQFVLVEDDNQSTYASTFAIGDVAGSALTFQHMIQNGEWRQHSNASNAFGALKLHQWNHLSTVYDNGTVHRYLNGILVGSFQPNSSDFNNVDLYRIGVNRAGSSFYKGFVDRVVVYDSALSNDEVQQLSREVYKNCGSFSSSSTSTVEIWQNMTLPNGLDGHAWILYGYGSSGGEVSGTFDILIEGYDNSGLLVSQNRTGSQLLAENWNSKTVRFRPHENATTLRIVIELQPSGPNSDGTFYMDSLNLRSIRPHNGWVDGSIAETAVSTGGRSFAWGSGYGQSLVADLLEDGVSGVKGYVYEPYLTAVGYPSVLMESYVQGYNLAESHAAANLITGWMGVVVGDPKMAPFADQFHDVNIIDARLVGVANENQNSTIEVALENVGMSAANGSLVLVNLQGNILLHQTNLTIPAGDQNGSRLKLELSFSVSSTDWMNIRVRWLNGTPERRFQHNIVDLGFPVNSKPVISNGYCSASELARGGYTICNILASDDENVTSVMVEWKVGNQEVWTSQNATYLFNDRWEIIVTIPTTSTLGNLSLRATAYDANGLTDFKQFSNVTRILNASQSWYGPFIEGLDHPNWDRASILPSSPPYDLQRAQSYVLIVCAKDADFEPEYESPTLQVNRGNITELLEIESPEVGVFCYQSSYVLARSSSLEDVEFSVYNSNSERVSYRVASVGDIAPSIQMTIESDDGTLLDRVLNNGREYLRIQITDIDDEESPFIGDLRILWPGGEILQFPIDMEPNEFEMLFELAPVQHALETGIFWAQITGTGLHGSVASQEIEYPLIMTPPKIRFAALCDTDGIINSMNFGQIATWTVVFESDRPIEASTVSLIQEGWSVQLPVQEKPVWDEHQNLSENCSLPLLMLDQTQFHYRVRLDSTFVEGDGQLLAYLKDIDGLVHTVQQSIQFTRAPTVLQSNVPSNISTGQDLVSRLGISDEDGLSGIICSLQILDQQSNVLTQFVELAGDPSLSSNELMWVYPVPRNVENQSITLYFECINEQFEAFSEQRDVLVDPYIDPCLDSALPECNPVTPSQTSKGNQATQFAFVAVGIVLFAIFTALLLSRKRMKDDVWASQADQKAGSTTMMELDTLFDDISVELPTNEEPVLDFIPEGWTKEQFSSWLEGPVPEHWTEVQWEQYVIEHQEKLKSIQFDLEKN